jgi:poly-gamma-glutamate synthesis protein (capsule biosynthesis protein)
MPNDRVVLMACGDVGPIHEPVAPYSELVRDTLASADFRIAQAERVYSERGAYQVHSGGHHSRVKPHMASVFKNCGFDLVSVASNHAMDWGADALLDSIELIRSMGIVTVGAGRNLEEARQPAIIERNGVRIGVLAYCSVLREGYAAGPNTPGVAPLRAHTYYEPHDYQPGIPPHVVTVPYADDLHGMVEDLRAVRAKADIVVLILHWGLHFIPRLIADYQRTAAKVAFEAGASIIFGHHAHVAKGIEEQAGKVCFYSLSNFIMTAPPRTGDSAARFQQRFGVPIDPEYPLLPYGPDAKRSLIGKAVLSKLGVERVSYIPVLIDKQSRPEVLRNGDSRFDDAVRYMDWASEGLDHRFAVDGDEVVIFTR